MEEERASLEKQMTRAVSVATQDLISGDRACVYVKLITHGADHYQRVQVCEFDSKNFLVQKLAKRDLPVIVVQTD